MSLYTSAEIKSEILDLKTKIAKAETAQEYSGGPQVGLKRGALDTMYQRLKHLEELYRQVESQETGAGSTALVQFEGPS